MKGHDPKAIANKFSNYSSSITQMKLQKLVYIANGWSLAITDIPLVDAEIEAWLGGPVIREIWDHIRDHGLNSENKLCNPTTSIPYDVELSKMEEQIIEYVWKKYGDYSGSELSTMTHKENTPWSKAFLQRGRNATLRRSEIKQHFIELALEGRKQQTA